MKKVFGIALLAVLGLFLVACVEDTTTAVTTADQTTAVATTATPVDLAALMTALKTQYASTLEDANFLATEDLALVATAGDLTITYSSGNAMYLEDDGTIHRPSYATGNQTVVLTASITDGTDTESYAFYVTVQALEKSDLERANEVFLIVTAFPTKEKWTAADEVEFLITGKDLDDVDYDVVWTSSLPANMSVEGVIVQPDVDSVDVVVTMTATITINSVDFTHEVVFTIAKIEEATVVASIAAAAAIDEVEPYVQMNGLTVTDFSSEGNIFLTDGTDLIYVYGPKFVLNIGDVVDITGEFAYYYNSPQLQTSPIHPLICVTSTAAAVASPVNTPESLTALIAGLSVPSTAEPWAYEYYEVTAKIYVNDDWGNYSTFLVPLDYDFEAALAVGAEQPNGSSIMIYYKSNMDLLATLDGEEVTLTILTQGYRTDRSVYYANFFGTAEDLSVAFEDDATAVASALESFMYEADIVENTTLFMPASVYGVDLSYASNNAVIIDSTTGAVDTSTLTNQVQVTVTITATKGLVSDTRDITINVGVLPLSTIVEVKAFDEDTKVKVRGIVTAGEYYETYTIQDTTGGIVVNQYKGAELLDFLKANLGNEVEVIGELSLYHGMLEVVPSEIVLIAEATVPAATNLDAIAEDDFFDYVGMLVEYTDLYVLSVDPDDGGYGNFYAEFIRVSDGAIIQMKWDSRTTLTTEASAAITALAVGDKVSIVAGLGWYDAARLFYTDTTVITEGTPYTDAELLAIDAANFEAAVTITTDYMLPELQYADGTTVAIHTDLQAYLVDDLTASDSLEVTLPNGDVTGTATFTLTLNDETLDVVVTITLDGMTEAEKLAADQTSLEIDLTAVANETIELPLTGVLGTTVVWTVVSGDATLNVDGKTLVFGDATADYDVVLQATLSIGSETDVTKDFTVAVTGYTIVTDFATLYVQTEADVWDVANDVTIYVQGTVSGFGYKTVFLQDANGVGVKISGNIFGDLNLGDAILIGGKLEDNSDVRQFNYNPMLIAVVSTGNAVTPIAMTNDQIIAITAADTGKLITVTGAIFHEIDGSYYTFEVNGTSEASVILSIYNGNIPAWFDDVYEAGDVINDLTFIFSKFHDAELSIENFDLVQTEADKVEADAAQLPTTLTLSVNEVLPTPVYGSTFTVTGQTGLTAYIDYTSTPGTLIVLDTPVDAVIGTVTVDVVQGGTTETVTITVTVQTPVVATGDLFISEYGEGSSNNKWIELYNPTDQSIDLSGYTLKLNVNDHTGWDNVVALSGTLAPGDVYVIMNNETNSDVQLVIDNADLTEAAWPAVTICTFNGDDAIGLFNGDTLIDLFGIFEEDPGSSWEVGDGSTANHTLVRKATVTGPNATWDTTEWTVYAENTDDYVGSHTMN